MKTFSKWIGCVMLLLMTAWTSQSYAQTVLKGRVIDSVSQEPLLGAQVAVNDREGNMVGGGATDFIDGNYEIELTSGGDFIVQVNYMGFQTKKINFTIKEGETKEIPINMNEEVNLLKTVTKTATRFETPVGKTPISLDVVKPNLVDNTNATKVDEVVDKVPGVTVVDGQANIRGGSGCSYGAGSRVLLLVDDLPFLAGDAGFPNWRDIPVENISQIEIVKGAASALYGSSALNGIINIRTAYPTKKPYTKFSLFQTSFVTPRRPEIAWWKYDSLRTHDADAPEEEKTCPSGDCEEVAYPSFMSGRAGYRKPIEFGAQFAHRRKIGKFDLTTGGNYFYQDSYRAGEYERKGRLTANTRYRFNERINAGINVNFNYGRSSSFFLWNNETESFYESAAGLFIPIADQTVDTAVYIPRPGSLTETGVLRFNIDPFFTAYDKHQNRHRLQTRFYYVNNQSSLNQSNQSNLFYGEYQFQRKIKINSDKVGDLKLVAGAVGQYTFVNAELYGNAQYDVSNMGAYVQVEQGFFKEPASDNCKLNVSFGARYEHNIVLSPDSVIIDPIVGLEANPNPVASEGRPVFRVGLNYEAADFTFIRASWGQGYRFPTVAERFISTLIGSGQQSLAIRANPSLSSETGWSAELGIKQGFKISNWKGFADVSLFWTEYQDMMEFTFGGGRLVEPTLGLLNSGNYLFFQSVNIDDTRILGAEFSVMGTGELFGAKTNVLTGYTLIQPRFQNWENNDTIRALSSADQNILKYRSVHTVKFDIESFFLKDDALSVGLTFNYNSPMQAVDNAFVDLLYNDNTALGEPNIQDAFGIGYYRENINDSEMFNLGARVSYKYYFKNGEGNNLASLKLSLVGKNLLNQEYTIRPALVAAPMNITVRADVEF